MINESKKEQGSLKIEISETLEETGRNKIFQAYLFIIILHEFVHLT